METEHKIGRREILLALGAGGAGVAVAASGPLVGEAADGEPTEEKRKARYQANSPDVQAYYRVNRYPSK